MRYLNLAALLACVSMLSLSPSSAASQSSEVAGSAATSGFQALPDNTRYLSIMGTLDGLSATKTAPRLCFPAGDMLSIDRLIVEKGFAGIGLSDLPETLTRISDQCGETSGIGGGIPYRAALFQEMSEDLLMTYVTSAFNSFRSQGLCKEKQSSGMIEKLAEALKSAEPLARPQDVLEDVLKSNCHR